MQSKWSCCKGNISCERYKISNTLHKEAEIYFLHICYIWKPCIFIVKKVCSHHTLNVFFFAKPVVILNFVETFLWKLWILKTLLTKENEFSSLFGKFIISTDQRHILSCWENATDFETSLSIYFQKIK